jgi:hypothetical protein
MSFDSKLSKVLPYPYKYLFHIDEFDFNLNKRVINLVFKINDIYLILIEDFDKVRDVDMMPDYIQKDWLHFTSRNITLIDVEKLKGIIRHILCLDDESREPEEKVYKVFTQYLNIVKIIERDLKIKNLLS